MRTPGAAPIVQIAARNTSAVVCTAPATQPSASPSATSESAKYSGSRASRSASSRLRPLPPRRARRCSTTRGVRGSTNGSTISTPRDGTTPVGASLRRTSTGTTEPSLPSAITASIVRLSVASGKTIVRGAAAARSCTERRKVPAVSSNIGIELIAIRRSA